MSFDSMALAVDWLDAYRGKSLDLIELYQADAVLGCACGTATMVLGTTAIEDYWRDRFAEEPAFELVDLIARGETSFRSSTVPRWVWWRRSWALTK